MDLRAEGGGDIEYVRGLAAKAGLPLGDDVRCSTCGKPVASREALFLNRLCEWSMSVEHLACWVERAGAEVLVAAAVQSADGRRVLALPRPARHYYQVIFQARGVLEGWSREDVVRQGFVTSAGRFLDRIEAEKVARAAGQLLREPRGVMTSEDLW